MLLLGDDKAGVGVGAVGDAVGGAADEVACGAVGRSAGDTAGDGGGLGAPDGDDVSGRFSTSISWPASLP